MGNTRKYLAPLSLFMLLLNFFLAACGENTTSLSGSIVSNNLTSVTQTSPTVTPGQASSTVTSSPATPSQVHAATTAAVVSSSPEVTVSTPPWSAGASISPALTVSSTNQDQVQKLLVQLWKTYK